jgi:hypothetical protein
MSVAVAWEAIPADTKAVIASAAASAANNLYLVIKGSEQKTL